MTHEYRLNNADRQMIVVGDFFALISTSNHERYVKVRVCKKEFFKT